MDTRISPLPQCQIGIKRCHTGSIIFHIIQYFRLNTYRRRHKTGNGIRINPLQRGQFLIHLRTLQCSQIVLNRSQRFIYASAPLLSCPSAEATVFQAAVELISGYSSSVQPLVLHHPVLRPGFRLMKPDCPVTGSIAALMSAQNYCGNPADFSCCLLQAFPEMSVYSALLSLHSEFLYCHSSMKTPALKGRILALQFGNLLCDQCRKLL